MKKAYCINNYNQFYKHLERCSKQLIQEIITENNSLITKISQDFSNQNILETKDTIALDMLILGVYVDLYLDCFPETGILTQKLFLFLLNLRKRNKYLKPYIDILRAVSGSLFLIPKKKNSNTEITYQSVKDLIKWMQINGEYNQDSIRLNKLLNKLHEQKADIKKIVQSCVLKFNHFLKQEMANEFTELSDFQKRISPSHKWKEDFLLLNRKREEYILNCIGAVTLNSSMFKLWECTKEKYILLPSCMRIYNNSNCKASDSSFDLKCNHCNKQCTVQKLNEIAKGTKYKIRIITHSTGFSKWFTQDFVNSDVGIIGITCILNLMSGGWEAMHAGVPAQCILLLSPGCKAHWDKIGFSTEIDLKEFNKYLCMEVSL